MSANGFHFIRLIAAIVNNTAGRKSTKFSTPLSCRHRARRHMAIGNASLLYGYVEGMHVQNMNHNIICVWIMWSFTLFYEMSTTNGTNVPGIACFFHVNGDTWSTTPVQYYRETPSGY
jgi:hypothetical protein